MHFFKKLVGVVLALILVVTVLPTAFARQYYSRVLKADDVEEINAMLDEISQQTFADTDAETVRTYIEHFLYRSEFAAVGEGRFRYTNAQGYWWGKSVQDGTYYQVVNGTGCFAYSKFVALAIYGVEGKLLDVGQAPGRITGKGLKTFIEKYAQAGEHIRIDNRHSVTYISHTEDGFYFMDYAGDEKQKIALCYSTYDNFAAKCNEVYVRVLLFDSNCAVNGENVSVVNSSEWDWLADYAATAQAQGLIQNTDGVGSGMSITEKVSVAAKARSLCVDQDSEKTDAVAFMKNFKNSDLLNSDLINFLHSAEGEQFNLLYLALLEDVKADKSSMIPDLQMKITRSVLLEP